MKEYYYYLKVFSCTEIKPDIFNLTFSWPNHPIIRPNQYIRLKASAEGSTLSRPFSVSSVDGEFVSIIMEVVGPNTRAYSKSNKGDVIKVFGPDGNECLVKKDDRRYVFVGGGTGAAGFKYQVAELKKSREENILVLLGAKIPQKLLIEEFATIGCEVKTIAETGEGNTGQVTKLLEDELCNDAGKSLVIACGPIDMLEKVSRITESCGNDCYVSMERIMACGVGSCKGCQVFGRDKHGEKEVKYVCIHGPVFDAHWIDWRRTNPPIIEFPLPESEKTDNPMTVVLAGQYHNLELNPLITTAAGCLEVDTVENDSVDVSRAGALSTKVVTREGMIGNFGPRIGEGYNAVFNSIGWANDGLKVFLENLLPRWLKLNIPVIPNIGGFSEEEYVENAREIVRFNVAGIEVNLSCFNVNKVVTDIGKSCERSRRLISKIREVVPNTPLIVKLTTGTGDLVPVAEACKNGGADILSIGNTAKAAGINVRTRLPRLGKITGGLSGPAIHSIVLGNIIEVYQAGLGLPIIGIGGCRNAEDALEFIIGGASAIGVGTELFPNPCVITDMYNGLLDLMEYHGANHIYDLKGSLQKYDIENL